MKNRGPSPFDSPVIVSAVCTFPLPLPPVTAMAPDVHLPSRTPVSVLLASLIALQGCSVIGVDLRERVGAATLFNDVGLIDERAFAGALAAKFAGAPWPPAALTAYVESLGGTCGAALTDTLHCSIPLSASFCQSRQIDITARISRGKLEEIAAKNQNRSC